MAEALLYALIVAGVGQSMIIMELQRRLREHRAEVERILRSLP